MCATLTARRAWLARSTVVSGLAAGLAGAALFILVHSLVIFPIWTRFPGHLPFAIAAGLGLAGAFNQTATTAGWRSTAAGARFGLVIFATLTPATFFSNALRIAGAHANEWPGFVGTIALAIASGSAAGRLVTRRWRGAMAFAVATLALTIAMGGAIPVVNSARATLLFAGFLPICVGSGVALAAARQRFAPEEHE